MKRQHSISHGYYLQQQALMRPLMQATREYSWDKRWEVAEAATHLNRRLRHIYPRGKAYERLAFVLPQKPG